MRHLITLILALVPLQAWAEAWDSVEVDLSLRPDGKASLVSRVAIDPQGMQLHGFCFQAGMPRPHFDRSRCYALGPDNARYDLAIQDLGDKFDVVLGGGLAISRGRVVYVLTYGADLASAGHLAKAPANRRSWIV